MSTVSLTLSQVFEFALKAYQAGKLTEAEQLCLKILSADPSSAPTLNLLAVVNSASGRNDMAVSNADRALSLQPDFVEALVNRGIALCELKRFGDALADYDRAIALRPNNADALVNRGNALGRLQRHEDALASYDRALALQPRHVEALHNRGISLHKLGRYDEALASYGRALALHPGHARALVSRGATLHDLRQYEEALKSYDGALALRPDHAETLVNRGVTLHELKQSAEALQSYDRALAIAPDHVEALTNRGVALHDLERYDEALAGHERALAAQPDHAAALSNRGVTLHRLGRLDEALASYDRALALKPDYADALVNRGVTLHDLKRFEEALASYDRAIVLRPDHADAHFFGSMSRLLTADFGRGWIEYEWRRKGASTGPSRRDFLQPLWFGGEEIAGKTLLLHSEQGFGDTIQFCRYAPLVAGRGARVILEVEEPLQGLLTGLAGTTQVIAKGHRLPDFDLQCPLLSLPLAFRTQPETIPSAAVYLRAPDRALLKWGARLPSKRPRIGIAWSGNAKHLRDRERSIDLRDLLPLVNVDATIVSLQKEVRAADGTTLKERGGIVHFGHELENFSDTAALISHLDLVISVDTAIAHLAGALGKPVWILLTHVPDWRWLLDRDDSPWYPTARLFRQSETREWDSVIASVRDALLKFIGSKLT
jgi:tetratricopeptide (TPR) repeat protein